MTCLDLDGKVRWASGPAAKFGLGPFMIADGKLIVMNDDGLLTLAEAGPAGYRALVKNRVLNGHDSWAPMALAGGRLLVRDLTQLVCLDITGAKP
jgi:outer membrane protein assembly factor BamB